MGLTERTTPRGDFLEPRKGFAHGQANTLRDVDPRSENTMRMPPHPRNRRATVGNCQKPRAPRHRLAKSCCPNLTPYAKGSSDGTPPT